MKHSINTWLNYREQEHDGETNTLPSQTQPNEVMSIKEMLVRHAQGLPMHGAGNENYYDEELGYIPDIETLDLTEIADYRDHYAQKIKEIEAEIQSRKEQKSGEADKPTSSVGQDDNEAGVAPDEVT